LAQILLPVPAPTCNFTAIYCSLKLYFSLFPLPLTELVRAGNKALTHMAIPDPNHVDVDVDVDVGMNQLINNLVFECLYTKFL
jgi:hypothetical protein